MKNKIFTFIFSFFFLCINAFTQPIIKKQFVIGGSISDQVRAMCPTKDGGVITGGNSSSNRSGDKTQNSRGNFDYWVVKQDSSGNIQWDRTIGGDGVDKISSLQQTSDGGYIVGGSSNSEKSGEKSEDEISFTTDYWIVKLDALGNIQWDKTIGGTGDDYLMAVIQTTDGGYMAGGYSASNKSRNKTRNSRGLSDY
jgi:hypothetical protein